jgi:hypothetical protein
MVEKRRLEELLQVALNFVRAGDLNSLAELVTFFCVCKDFPDMQI